MKYLLVLTMLPLSAAAQVGAVRGLLDCPGITNSMKCARFAEDKLKAPFVSRKNESLLAISLLSGGTRDFRDSDAYDTKGVRYSAIAVSQDARYVTLHRQFREGEASVYDARPDKWGALDATWTSANALRYMHATFECYESRHGKPYNCQRETLQYDGALWH